MVRHIVMWAFKEEVNEDARKEALVKIKEGLEGLFGVVPGLLKAEVITDPISSSSHDLCLLSELDSRESLEGYAVNPDHLKVAAIVRSVTCNRACMDYEV